MHTHRVRWVALVLGALAAVGLAATAFASQAKVTKIGIATPEKANDYGWNQQGVRGARAAASSASAKLTVADGVGYDNTESVLRQLAQAGNDFVIAQASGYNTIAPRVAQQFKVPMISYDNPKGVVRNYMGDVETSSQQGAYLAGVLAAKKTKTKKLGIVISAADTNWYKQTGGFVAGARSVAKGLKFYFAQVGQAGYADAAGGKRVTQSVISRGADVVFGMGDGASFGYLQAIETAKAGHKVWFIDVIGNKTPIDKKHVLLSSVIWDFTKVFKKAIADINSGNFGKAPYFLTVKNGISLLKTKYIPAATWRLVESKRKAIASGKIKIPLTPNRAAVNKILKGK